MKRITLLAITFFTLFKVSAQNIDGQAALAYNDVVTTQFTPKAIKQNKHWLNLQPIKSYKVN